MEQKAQKLILGTVGVAGLFLAGGNSVSANTTHKVSTNDTVWGISQKYGVSIQSIEELNQIDSNSHLIFTGHTLQIPDKGTKSVTKKAPQTKATKATTATSTYAVKAGDSLWSIAQKHQTSVDHLRSLNSLGSNVIFPGQTLKVDGTAVKAASTKKAPVATQAAAKASVATPAQGSTPSVAQPTQTAAKETETTTVKKNQAVEQTTSSTATKETPAETPKADTVKQAAPQKVQPQVAANHTSHTVVAGESLFSIAQDYGVTVDSIRQANAIDSSVLAVDQSLTINNPTKTPVAADKAQSSTATVAKTPAKQQNNSNSAASQVVKPAAAKQQQSNTNAVKPSQTNITSTQSSTTAKPSQTTTSGQSTATAATPVASTPTTTSHSNGYNPSGNTYDWGQCTWFAKNRASWAGNYWGNGGNWDTSARAQGFTVNNQPTAGSLVVFHPGQSVGGQWTADSYAGHVAYVESVSGNTITISQGGMGFSNPGGPNYQTITSASQYTYIHNN